MGCGQLELCRALSGKLRPDAGRLIVNGRAAHLDSTARAKLNGIAILPESRRAMLFGAEPVYRNISISVLEHISRLFVRPQTERRMAAEKVEQWTKIDKEVVYMFLGPAGVHTLDPSIKSQWLDALGVDYGVLKGMNLVKDLDLGAWVNDGYVRQA